MPPDYDCLVVGAGLVGATQALALSQLGLNVAVIESRAPLAGTESVDVRGLALAFSSRQVLAATNVWRDLAGHVTPIRHIHVSDQGSFGFTRLHAVDAGIDALGYVCAADRLASTLETALQAQCTVLWQTTIERLSIASDRAFVQVRSDAGAATYSARLVVGADGVHSQVRAAANIGSKTRDYRQAAIVANVTIDDIATDTAYERFTCDGPLALLPIAPRRHVVVRCCNQRQLGELLALDDAAYLKDLKQRCGFRFGRFTDLGKRSHYPLTLTTAERIVAPRVALAGAAANSIHPNGAQGLNLGLRDVAGLAARVKNARGSGEDIGGEACLAAFARGRRSDQRAVIRFTDTLAQLFSSRLPLLPGLRGAALIALDLHPPLKRAVIRRASGLLGETPLREWTPGP